MIIHHMFSKEELTNILSWFSLDTYRTCHHSLGLDIEEYKGFIFTPMLMTTAIVCGEFHNLDINEKRDINKFKECCDKFILIGSCYGKYVKSNYDESPIKKLTNRGRPPKDKREKKKEIGNGGFFPYHIAFYYPIVDKPNYIITDKIFKIRVYNTNKVSGFCSVAIPGVNYSNYSIAMKGMDTLEGMLRDVMGNDEIKFYKTGYNMQNYQWKFLSDNISVHIIALGEIIEARKKWDPIQIFNVEYRTTKTQSMVNIKLSRPSEKKMTKTTTVKIRDKTITIEGTTSFDDAWEIYNWLTNVILQQYKECIFDDVIDKYNLSDSSDTEDECYVENDNDDTLHIDWIKLHTK